MADRAREWLRKTHGPTFELARHFFAQLFHSDLFSPSGEWTRTGIGIVATVVPLGLLFFPMFYHRYECVEAGRPMRNCPAIADYHAEYLRLLASDRLWLIALAMAVTALASSLRWEALFPTRRDAFAMASLPLTMRQVFVAKLSALVAAFPVFAIILNLPPAMLLSAAATSRWQEHPSYLMNTAATFACMTAAGAFVFFTLLSVQGVLLNVLTVPWFDRVAGTVQAAIFTGSVAILPYLWGQPDSVWWPPSWFLHPSIALIATPPLAMLPLYLASYHRFQRLLVEAPRSNQGGRCEGLGSWILDRWIADPREQAVFAFIAKTLMRSRTHRLVLQICIGLGIAFALQGAAGSHSNDLQFLSVFAPLMMSVCVVLGLRYLFALPVEMPANWIFRTTEPRDPASWLRGVERFVVWCGIVPLYALALPAAIAGFGWWRGLRVSTLGLPIALAVFEYFFRHWRKAPYTCSYLPGKRPLWQHLLLALLVGLPLLAAASALTVALSDNLVLFAAALPIPLTAWQRLRRERYRDTETAHFVYEEQPESLITLGLTSVQAGAVWQRRTAPAIAIPEARPRWWPGTLERRGWWEDLRIAFRLILRNPALSAAVLVTLAIGIGMNVTVLTLLNGLMFRAHVQDPGSFVRLFANRTRRFASNSIAASTSDYEAWRARTRTLRALAAWSATSVTFAGDVSNPERALLVSCNFFDVYGEPGPAAGRYLRADDCGAGAGTPAAVLSQETWRDRFDADPQIVGRTVPISGSEFTIVGIAPERYPGRQNGTALWLPYTQRAAVDPSSRRLVPDQPWLALEGRLARGVTLRQAREEFARLGNLTVDDGSWATMVRRNGDSTRLAGLITLVAAAFGALLLMTCANAATLLLSRAVSRRREMAVRLSMGAPRGRLVRLLLAESLVLSVGAAAIALTVACVAPAALYRFAAGSPAEFPLSPDWRIFAYVTITSLAAGCLAGLAPAMESLRVNLVESLRGYDPMLGRRGFGARLRGVLVTTQVALSLALLVGSGVMLNMQYRWANRQLGYDPRHTVVTPLHADPASVSALAAAIRRLPNVRSAQILGEVPSVPSTAAGRVTFVLATFSGDAPAMVAAIRAAARGLDSNLKVTPRLAEWWIDDDLAQSGRIVGLTSVLGAVSLLLAMVGVYGVISYAVRRDRRDLGIRVALGAGPSDIAHSVLRGGMRPVLRGLFYGLWLAMAAEVFARKILKGPFDGVSANNAGSGLAGVYASAAALLLLSAVVAILPAIRRAIRSQPYEALRG